MNKKTLSLLILLAALFANAACASEGGEGNAGNGGGGVLQDGRYMTFYSAGLYTEPDAKTPTEIPGLDMTKARLRLNSGRLPPPLTDRKLLST